MGKTIDRKNTEKNNEFKRIVGFDASTSTIGVAVIDYKIGQCDQVPQVKLIHNEFFKPPKKGTIFEILNKTREYITTVITDFKPDSIALEDIILFMKGHSTAKTISKLAVLNRTVGLAIYNSGIEPELLNVMKIRHAIKLDKKLPSKESIPDLAAHHLGIDSFPYQMNKKNKPIIENYDMADAMAVALASIHINARS